MDKSIFSESYAPIMEISISTLIMEHLDQFAGPDTPLHSIADDLDIMEIFMAVEEDCSVEISEEDAAKMETVSDIVNWLGEHMTEEDIKSYIIMYTQRSMELLASDDMEDLDEEDSPEA